MLIPKIQEYIQKDVHSKSKEKHISYICKFYLATLEEYYQVNSNKVAKTTVADKRIPNDTGLEIFKTKLILAVHGNENDEQKTVFEKMINEIQNIEYALNYLIKVYQVNRKKRES